MSIKAGQAYIFKKSGNTVRTKEPTSYGGKGSWVVARIDTGKEMIVPGSSLVEVNHPDWQ